MGTRPNLTKLSPDIPCDVINTGQHYDFEMDGIFIRDLGIKPPKWNLGVTELDKMILGITEILRKEKPSLVLVYGDTRSTLAGARAATSIGIPVAHIEAGCRSGDRKLIEEKIRIEVDALSSLKFCPTPDCLENLRLEGNNINSFWVGDVLYDTYLRNRKHDGYVFVTIHRENNINTEKRLKQIIDHIAKHKDVIFSLHPHTKKMINKFKIKIPSHIKVIEPISYKKVLKLLRKAKLVITDSGGIQREAFFSGTPFEILRAKNEWGVHQFGDGTAGKKINKIINDYLK